MVLEPSLVSVQACLDYVLSLVRERAAAHAIELGLEVADDVGIVWADELRFKQVVLNLVSNAVKFTPDGGRVDVRAERDEARRRGPGDRHRRRCRRPRTASASSSRSSRVTAARRRRRGPASG